jgi:urea carboxylase-associated protein 2
MRGCASALERTHFSVKKFFNGGVQMLDLDRLTPAEYRARYLALQQAARARAAAPPVAPPIMPLPPAAIRATETIPAGCYVALRLKRFDVIRIENVSGTPGAALFLWNADEVSERYNAGDTVKLQWTTKLTTGRVLFSDMGRVLASITADTGAGHDSILGPNTPAQTAGRNGRDNLRLAAAKFGLTRRDLAPALSLFSNIGTDETGRFHFHGVPPAGAMVELRAEQNLLVALSNTPHVLSPVQNATGPLEIVIAHVPPGPDDLCRHFSPEAERGFINTDRDFAP